MAERMLQFVRLDQRNPEKRAASVRREDFAEIYRDFDPAAAAQQSSRCSQCGVPFCQVHCPLNNNIPDWLKLTAEGRLEEAYEVASATNTFPEICGRICPQDRLCEGNCVIEKGFESVTIGAVERYITDTAWERGWVSPPTPRVELPHSIGIIGAGPAGLAVAERLRRRGWGVHVYDRHDRVGGLMIYGIPNFKLEKAVVLRRWRQFEAGGIRFHLDCVVGRDVTLAELRARHDAVFIATGVYRPRDIDCPGLGLDGVVPALDYLTASNRNNLGDAVAGFDSGALDARGKRVVVVGGGDTAMDCVRTAVRQGAAAVTCLYRRDRANMPGSMRRALRMAGRAGGLRRQGWPRRGGTRHAHASRPARRDRAPAGGADPGQRVRAALRPRHQGARLRPRGHAGHVRRAGPGGDAPRHVADRPPHDDDLGGGRLRRRRHRARRLPGGLGDPRRARRG